MFIIILINKNKKRMRRKKIFLIKAYTKVYDMNI